MIWNENKDETVGVERIWLNEIGKERIEYVQIVRCKDCKHYENSGWFTQCFRHNGISPDSDWFCSDGERKEGW